MGSSFKELIIRIGLVKTDFTFDYRFKSNAIFNIWQFLKRVCSLPAKSARAPPSCVPTISPTLHHPPIPTNCKPHRNHASATTTSVRLSYVTGASFGYLFQPFRPPTLPPNRSRRGKKAPVFTCTRISRTPGIRAGELRRDRVINPRSLNHHIHCPPRASNQPSTQLSISSSPTAHEAHHSFCSFLDPASSVQYVRAVVL